MVESAGIEEVRQRARDFTKALRESGADDIADSMERHIGGFVEHATVRRSVEAIRQQLRHFRAYPEELPEQPVVHIAANRLEDACKQVLRADVITPARMSLRAQSKRKLSLVASTLFIATLLLGLPLALALSGVDMTDLSKPRVLGVLEVPKDSLKAQRVNVLEPSADPAHTTGVQLYVAGQCPAQLAGGMSCRDAGARDFGSQKLQAYELMLRGEAYGVLIAFVDTGLVGAVGTGSVLVRATPDSPEGLYVVPLQAAFMGYTPERCGWLLQLLSRCTSAERGPTALDADHPVATLQVRVLPRLSEESRADALARQRLEQQRAISQRVAHISAVVGAVRAALDDTERQLRTKHAEAARERLDELGKLFEPLDALVVSTADGEALPEDVLELRSRFEQASQKQTHFEQRAFDIIYAALAQRRGHAASDEQVFARVSRRLGISPAYLERIYAEHAEQIEQRLKSAEEGAKLAQQRAQLAVQERCGPLPKSSFREVQAYLSARAQHFGIRLRMHECLTPRLSSETCWSVVCDFEDVRSEPDSLEDEVVSHTWTFELRKGRVVGHVERRSD